MVTHRFCSTGILIILAASFCSPHISILSSCLMHSFRHSAFYLLSYTKQCNITFCLSLSLSLLLPCHTILYYTILYYTILYYTILYYTILYYCCSLRPDVQISVIRTTDAVIRDSMSTISIDMVCSQKVFYELHVMSHVVSCHVMSSVSSLFNLCHSIKAANDTYMCQFMFAFLYARISHIMIGLQWSCFDTGNPSNVARHRDLSFLSRRGRPCVSSFVYHLPLCG
jgi:hypothetical protein